MKRKYIIVTFVIIVLLFVILIKFFFYGSVMYSYNDNIKIKIPSFSFFYKEYDSMLMFKTLKSIFSTKIDVSIIKADYERYLCRNDEYYYDTENDVTIVSYDIKKGFLFNNIYIKYYSGKYNNNYCNKVTDPLKTNYSFLRYSSGSTKPYELYYNDNNNVTHTIYYDLTNGRLLFKNGKGKMIDFHSILKHKWITVDDVISLLDYQVEKGEILRVENDKSDYTLYKTKDFSLIRCNSKNKGDIYLEPNDVNFDNEFCN